HALEKFVRLEQFFPLSALILVARVLHHEFAQLDMVRLGAVLMFCLEFERSLHQSLQEEISLGHCAASGSIFRNSRYRLVRSRIVCWSERRRSSACLSSSHSASESWASAWAAFWIVSVIVASLRRDWQARRGCSVAPLGRACARLRQSPRNRADASA